MIWETLLGAALEASLGLLVEAGLGDEVRDLKARWTNQDEKTRQVALTRAFERAKDAIDDEKLRPLLDHRPFQEAVVTGLLDPMSGFDLQGAVADWEDRLPPSYIPALQRFFSTLQLTLLADETWGPVLERYQTLRFRQDVMAALEERALDVAQRRVVSMVHAELQGSGAIAQGEGAVAAGAGGMAIGGDVARAVQVVIQQLTVQHAPPVGLGPEDLRERYLTEVAHDANLLPWRFIEREYADPQSGETLGLAQVYTALDTTELERMEREEDLRRFLAQVARDETRRIPAQEMVNRENRLVILGDPGSGKSTLVKHLAYTLAQAGLAPSNDPAPWLERMAPWDHGPLLPVRVELRNLAAYAEGRTRENATLLLGYVHEHLKAWEMGDFWALLSEAIGGREDRILFLLDGLDEVPADLRGQVVGAVQDFADRYDHHRYVVTCRPYAYVGQPCQLRRFKEVTLAPFSEKQVDHFIETWYRELVHRDRLSSQDADVQTAQMQRAVRRGDLHGLAQRPLLLTVMTLLHTFRGELPQDRTELYADAVDLLLRRWEGRVGEEEGILKQMDIPRLSMSDLREGLGAVAFRAHSEGGAGGTEDTAEAPAADIDEAYLVKWLAPYLDDQWDKAREFVAYIRERTGLLVRHKTEAYTFPHRTFQEFMAACHLVGMNDYPDEASRLVREDMGRWREVFVLAAGHAARGQAISAVNALCPRDVEHVDRPDAEAYRRAQLAGDALLEIGTIKVQRDDVGQALLDRVRGWLESAMRADGILEARERASAGDALARLGDPRFRADAWYLPDEPLLGFVEVPAGPFLMGSDPDRDKMTRDNEQPQHKVPLPTYYIARYPVTVAQFRAFVEESGQQWRDPRSLRGIDNHPVVWVNWREAMAYCEWLTAKLRDWESTPEPLGRLLREEGWGVTLPSEPQWEKAARGEDGRRYPWGEDPDPERANYEDTGIGTTSAVGCFPGGASLYGVEDMSGNVWEWCRTKWEDNYKEYKEDNDLQGNASRVIRGGCFANNEGAVRCACRLRDLISRYFSYGLRVCVVAAPFSPTSDL